MFKFAHLADIHLGANRNPILEKMEIEKFNQSMDKCIEEKVDFILICGDLFHIGIPDMSIVKNCVLKLKEVYDQGIPVYVIFGSHDYNPNVDSIVDILEIAGLITNVAKGKDLRNGKLGLEFCIDKKTGVKIVGINARKGGVEKVYYEKLDRESLEKEKGFKIFCLHSGLSEFKPAHMAAMDTLPVSYLPKGFDYYAGGHIHERIEEKLPGYPKIVFPGPIFSGYPRDLERTAKGETRGFYIVSFKEKIESVEFVELFGPEKLRYIEIDVTGKNSTKANIDIEDKLKQINVSDKIVLLKIKGELEGGKTSEIRVQGYKNHLIENGAVFVDVNRYGLSSKEYSAVKVSGEDRGSIEKKLLRENIGSVNVSIQSLKGDEGSKVAEMLLDLLKIDAKINETKRDYTSRFMDAAINLLELKEVLS
ncbi:DNA repair exonuclease [Candidatus Bathyarchaeota archaeon]|nr:DNA repair exonuclease [Candidatus Bathyarchaeota archaeon]